MRVGRGFQVSGHFFLCFDHSKPLQVSSLQHAYRLFLVLPSTPKPTQLLVWSDLTLGWSNLAWSDPTVERNGHNLVISPAQLLIRIMLLMLCQINHCMWVVVGGGGWMIRFHVLFASNLQDKLLFPCWRHSLSNFCFQSDILKNHTDKWTMFFWMK